MKAQLTQAQAQAQAQAYASTPSSCPGVVLVGFKPPQGLDCVASRIGVSHAYLWRGFFTTSVNASDFAIILDCESVAVLTRPPGLTVATTVPQELSCVLVNRQLAIVGEFSTPCVAASSYGDRRRHHGVQQGMTGLSVPVVTDRNLEAVQTSVNEGFHNTRGSFLSFLQ